MASGGLAEDRASLSVVLRSEKDRETRLMVTFGYFFMNAALSALVEASVPASVFWSHTVSVTLPALAGSVETGLALLGLFDESLSPPGAQAAAAVRHAAVSAAAARRRYGV